VSDTPTSHLTAAQLRAYRDRRLTAAELLAVSDHLVDCAECRSSAVEPVELRAAFNRMQEAFPEHLTLEDLSQYVDGAADRAMRSRVEAHTAECEECARELGEYEALRDRPLTSVPATERAGSWLSRLLHQTFTPLRVATAMGVLAAAAALVWVGRDRNPGLAVAPGGVNPPPQAQPSPEAVGDVLRDGGREILVAADGARVSGLEQFAPADRELMERVLLSGRLEAPALRDLQRAAGVLLSGGSEAEASGVRLVAPVGVVIEAAVPVFRWSAVAGEFRVGVFDDEFRSVADSGWLTGTEWRALKPLPRGRRYTWQLKVRRDGKVTLVPAPPAPEARFRILSEAESSELGRVREVAGGSSVLLAAAYARMGLFAESKKELARLEAANPGSRLAVRLRESLDGRSVPGEK
jgi:anti-sigma factor RsiW